MTAPTHAALTEADRIRDFIARCDDRIRENRGLAIAQIRPENAQIFIDLVEMWTVARADLERRLSQLEQRS